MCAARVLVCVCVCVNMDAQRPQSTWEGQDDLGLHSFLSNFLLSAAYTRLVGLKTSEAPSVSLPLTTGELRYLIQLRVGLGI